MSRMPLSARGVLAAAILSLTLGACVFLAQIERAPEIVGAVGATAMMIPAIPMYVLATSFETRRSSGGILWATVHGPPFLTPIGVVVVYFLPALVALVWLFVRSRRTEPSNPRE